MKLKIDLRITHLTPSVIPGHITVASQKIFEPGNWVLINLTIFYLKFTTQ
jgi:hypothetical protein